MTTRSSARSHTSSTTPAPQIDYTQKQEGTRTGRPGMGLPSPARSYPGQAQSSVYLSKSSQELCTQVINEATEAENQQQIQVNENNEKLSALRELDLVRPVNDAHKELRKRHPGSTRNSESSPVQETSEDDEREKSGSKQFVHDWTGSS